MWVLVLVWCALFLKYKHSLFRTKVFIRFPKVLFATEDALQERKHDLGLYFLESLGTYWIVFDTQSPKGQSVRPEYIL